MSRSCWHRGVSTKEQNLDSQLTPLQSYAEARDFTIVECYQDLGVSGKVASRPALNKLMNDAEKRRFEAVLVWKFDRFARSTKHLVDSLERFRELGVGFISYTENIDTSSAMGKAVFTIISAIAEFERDLIRERVKTGLAVARERGVRLGRPPVVLDEQRIIELRREGMSVRKIAGVIEVSKSKVHQVLKEHGLAGGQVGMGSNLSREVR